MYVIHVLCIDVVSIYIYMGDIFHIHMRTLDSPSIHPKGFPGVHIIHIHTYLYLYFNTYYICIYIYT